MKKKRPADGFIILLLGSLSTVSPFAIDMYLPSFSQIANDLGTNPAKVSLSITSYFIGFALGQLFYGPLLDRFGRMKPLYFGLGIYVLACLGCMLSQTVEMLIVIRFIQALGGCVAGVAAISMVRDFFPVEKSAKIISMLILVIGLSPLLAPTIGGFVTTWLGWQWVFVVLILIVLLILTAVIFFLPEGHQPDTTVSLKLKPMVSTFYSILKNPVFSTYAFSGAFSFAMLFVYVAGSPFIFMELFHVGPRAYGGIFALLSVGFIGGNQVNILLLRKYTSQQLFRTALFCQVIFSLIFLTGVFNDWFNLPGTIVMFFALLSCLGLTYPNASALALAPFTRNIGSASALIGFLQIGVAGLASGCVGLFTSRNSVPIIAVMTSTSLVALLILLFKKIDPLYKQAENL
jgi:MFS transporter, DHA1 family, multidrug resistance protein